MRLYTAPEIYTPVEHRRRLFLAGGITGCPDWQQEVLCRLEPFDIDIFNPRRKDFDINDIDASRVQIEWEFNMLDRADAILFWFCKETVQPIVLFELGSHLRSSKQLFVGVHPLYPRAQDVTIQTRLVRPNLEIVSSIADFCRSVSDWLCTM